jgi:transposase
MELYVGLDVGLEKTSLCVIDNEGKTVREVKVATEPEAIRSALEGFLDRVSRIGVEASSLGIWLHRELHPAGLPMMWWKRVTCACRCRPCATKPTATTPAALRR